MDFLFIKKIKYIAELFKKAYGGYRFQVLLLAGMGFVGGLLEGIGINALIPFFSFLTGQSFEGANFIATSIESAFRYFSIDFSIKYILIFIIGLFIFKAMVTFFVVYMQNVISLSYEKKLRFALLRGILGAEWRYLLNQKVGDMSTVIIHETHHAATLLRTVGAVMLTATTLSVYVFMAFLISWKITATIFGLGVVLITLSKPLISRARGVIRESLSESKAAIHFINELTLNAKTVKSSFVNMPILKKADIFFEKFKTLRLRHFVYRGIFSSFIQPVSIIFISIIFVSLYKSSGFNLGNFIVLVYLIQRLFTYISQIEADVHKVNDGIPYLQSIVESLSSSHAHQEKDNGTKPFIFDKQLEIRDICFSYGRKQELLQNLSFTIKKGEMVGVVGPSGAGKTTFIDIILRLLIPHQGAIILDGENAEEIALKEWRTSTGYVSQDMHLLNDTMANNIAFFTPVSRETIEQAAKDSYIYDFIIGSSKGFDTMIGERGVKLSAGQRQRIVIARALARHPELLIFDEATSALDNESELRVQKTIENLRGKITTIVIAHRLSTVLNCDTILVLKNGRILEKGSPRALLENKNSYFFKTYNIRSEQSQANLL